MLYSRHSFRLVVIPLALRWQCVHSLRKPAGELGQGHDNVNKRVFSGFVTNASSAECRDVEGAESYDDELYRTCQCEEGYHSVQCGNSIVAGRTFNVVALFTMNSVCEQQRPLCTKQVGTCNITFEHDTEHEYIEKGYQGTHTDPFLVQMASIANQINSLGTPVAGWELVRGWNIGDERNCAYVQHVGIYQRDGRCALSFSSTERISDLRTSAKAFTRTWCDLPEVHGGYAARLDDFIHGHRFDEFMDFLNDKEQCPHGVVGVGHSMGAALISLMAACANSKDFFTVGELYTFAAPGVSKQQLTNFKSEDGCFKGKRIYIEDAVFSDPVPALSYPFGFMHPKVQSYRIKYGGNSNYTVIEHDCSSYDAQVKPRPRTPNPALHLMTNYIRRLLARIGIARSTRPA